MIDHLHPKKIIPGHMEAGWELDVKADIDHTRRYLHLFAEKVVYASGSGGSGSSSSSKPSVQELYDTFKEAFPECRENLDFFLGHMANRFGEGGRVWEENRHEDVGGRTLEELNGYRFG